MKHYLSRILVVEGKEDASYLSNYINSEIVFINGYELSKSTIDYLKDKPIILLLDPDEAGISIRNKLHNLLSDYVDVNIDISKCIKGIKNGVAECEISEILANLEPYLIEKEDKISDIKKSDLLELNLLGNKNLRKKVCQRLNLGECNGKTMHKRLINSGINKKELIKIVKEENGNK